MQLLYYVQYNFLTIIIIKFPTSIIFFFFFLGGGNYLILQKQVILFGYILIYHSCFNSKLINI